MIQAADTTIIEECDGNDVFAQFDGIIYGLSAIKAQISTLQQQIKRAEKSMKRHIKVLQKDAQKNKNKAPRKPSGFARPCKVTNELCEFMNKEDGTEIARTEVTKALVLYIKENKLENAANSQIITPDNKLKFLLGLCDGEELTYFNIQKYMNRHFVKSVVAV